MNDSVMNFEYYAVVKITLKQNKWLTAKSSKKRKLFKVIQEINLEGMKSPDELATK